MLQCVAVICRVVQCVAVCFPTCCSVVFVPSPGSSFEGKNRRGTEAGEEMNMGSHPDRSPHPGLLAHQHVHPDRPTQIAREER